MNGFLAFIADKKEHEREYSRLFVNWRNLTLGEDKENWFTRTSSDEMLSAICLIPCAHTNFTTCIAFLRSLLSCVSFVYRRHFYLNIFPSHDRRTSTRCFTPFFSLLCNFFPFFVISLVFESSPANEGVDVRNQSSITGFYLFQILTWRKKKEGRKVKCW